MAEAGSGASRPAPVTQTGSLLERERELVVPEGAVRDATAGRAALVVVDGQAGIGKSRLLAEARSRAGIGGSRVLSARGSRLERELPFGVVRQVFEPVLAEPGQRRRWLAGPAAAVRRESFATNGGALGAAP